MLGYVLDEVFVDHRAPSGHPERPARAEAVRSALMEAGIGALGRRVDARPATDDELARVHAVGYLDELTRRVPGKTGWLDADTYFSPGTWTAALAAAGGTIQLALDVLHGGRLDLSFNYLWRTNVFGDAVTAQVGLSVPF